MASPDDPAVLATEDDSTDMLDLALPLLRRWKLLIVLPLMAGSLALGISFLMTKTYISRTVLLPPQQQQSAAAAALSQLGALSGALGATSGLRSPADQYVALLQSTTVADRIVDAFDLMNVYEVRFRFEARRELAANARISAGRKDGLITVEVEDTDAQRAADMANRFVVELRELSNSLSLTEAQQRRVFFEQQLTQTSDRLAAAQKALEGSGFDQGALRADARAAAEGFARLRAEATAAEVRLQTLRRQLADGAPEVQSAAATLAALRSQLEKLTSPPASAVGDGANYIGRYREFKYQETLFELYARQFEIARLDESREGVLVQVVDPARPAEWKSRPKRANIAVTTTLLTFLALAAWLLMQDRLSRASGAGPSRIEAIRQALRGR